MYFIVPDQTYHTNGGKTHTLTKNVPIGKAFKSTHSEKTFVQLFPVYATFSSAHR